MSEFDPERLSRLVTLLSHVDSLDWKEFHFFKPVEGLAKSDLLEVRMCLDYERARESKKVIEDISVIRSSGYSSRWRLGRFLPVPFQAEGDLTVLQPVPVVCLEADWFPSAWLCGSKTQRRRIVKKGVEMYNRPPLVVLDFPLKFAESRLLRHAAKADKTVTLHVIALDRAEPTTAILERFKSWLRRQPGFTANASRRGKVKSIAELRDLGCYRLMKRLDSHSRTHAMREAGFNQSVPKLSQAARRAEAQLRRMQYIR